MYEWCLNFVIFTIVYKRIFNLYVLYINHEHARKYFIELLIITMLIKTE